MRVPAASFSGAGERLLTADVDGNVAVWNTQDADNDKKVFRHDAAVWSVAFSPDGTRLLTGGGTGLRLWDVASAKILSEVVVPTTGG